MNKSGFTIIEVIFAIVVLSIIVTVIPTIKTASSSSFENSLTQEALFATSSRLQYTAYTTYFDLNSTADYEDDFCNKESLASRVINSDDQNCSDKPGIIGTKGHRMCVQGDSEFQDSAAGALECRYNINDLVGEEDLIDDGNLSEKGYKNTYKIKLSVNRNDENKTIVASVYSQGKLMIKMSTIRTNIGGFNPIDLPSKILH